MSISKAPAIRWIEHSPDLYEARATMPDGRDLYVGYVAVNPGQAAWRGYLGLEFVHVGMGPRGVMQRAVEQYAVEALRRTTTGQAATHAS